MYLSSIYSNLISSHLMEDANMSKVLRDTSGPLHPAVRSELRCAESGRGLHYWRCRPAPLGTSRLKLTSLTQSYWEILWAGLIYHLNPFNHHIIIILLKLTPRSTSRKRTWLSHAQPIYQWPMTEFPDRNPEAAGQRSESSWTERLELLKSLGWFVGENLNRKPMGFYHQI